MSTVACPFCEDDDFDLPGLAYHLAAYCEKVGDALAEFHRVDVRPPPHPDMLTTSIMERRDDE